MKIRTILVYNKFSQDCARSATATSWLKFRPKT